MPVRDYWTLVAQDLGARARRRAAERADCHRRGRVDRLPRRDVDAGRDIPCEAAASWACSATACPRSSRASAPIIELAALFDAVVISFEVQLAKPEPEIYRVALDRLGVPAFDALFVDDRAENIDAARELGLQTLLFTGDVHALRAITLCAMDPREITVHRSRRVTKARRARCATGLLRRSLGRPGTRGEAARGDVRRTAEMRAAREDWASHLSPFFVSPHRPLWRPVPGSARRP